MAEDAEQSSESLSTSEEFEIVCGSETTAKSDEKLNKKSRESTKVSNSLFPMVNVIFYSYYYYFCVYYLIFQMFFCK